MPLKEEDAYPAQPQDAYGWEKLITERLCLHYREDYGLETRIVRFHNIFGPLGTWDGGREKAPAAMCRKVATAKLTGTREIEIWGDGEQTRSFCYIDDCVEGHHAADGVGLPRAAQPRPGPADQHQRAGRSGRGRGRHRRRASSHVPGPQGVRGRNSDNTRLREVLGWEPQISLEDGLARTYTWIEAQVAQSLASPSSGRPCMPCRLTRDRPDAHASTSSASTSARINMDAGARRDRRLDHERRPAVRLRHRRARRHGEPARSERFGGSTTRAGLVTPDGMPLVWLEHAGAASVTPSASTAPT